MSDLERTEILEAFKVYVIKCWNDKEQFYKIGRTFSSIPRRFESVKMPYNFEVIHEIVGESSYVYYLEQLLKNCNIKNKYIPLQEFGGRYECFRELNMSCFEDYNLNINN